VTLKVVVHEVEEGGEWSEVPAISGCATQGDTFEALLSNLYEAIEGCLSVDIEDIAVSKDDRVLEIAVANARGIIRGFSDTAHSTDAFQ